MCYTETQTDDGVLNGECAMEGQRCAVEGCRAWARRGTAWCVAHPDGQRRRTADDGTGVYATYVPVVALEEALKLPPGDLRLEIAVARAVLRELLRAGLSIQELVAGLDKVTGALARMLRLNSTLTADDQEAGDLEAIVAGLLADLRLGGT
jgi:hypothetical protein